MIIAAADGSSLSNPGPAGWAWYVDDSCWAAGGWPRGTNNMGELMAVLDLLRQTAASDDALTILCDSQYVINSVTKWMPGWKRRGWRKADGKAVQNLELLRGLDEALVGRDVTFEWVKGHAGHAMNEAADDRARAAATAFRDGVPVTAGPGFTRGGKAPVRVEEPEITFEEPAGPEPDLFSDPDPAPDRSTDEVVELERQLLRDDVRSNPARLRQLLHPSFVEHGPSGRIWTRGRLLSEIGPLEHRTTLEVLGADRLGEETLLLRWRARSSRAVTLRSSVWTRADGTWRLLFAQATPVEG